MDCIHTRVNTCIPAASEHDVNTAAFMNTLHIIICEGARKKTVNLVTFVLSKTIGLKF